MRLSPHGQREIVMGLVVCAAVTAVCGLLAWRIHPVFTVGALIAVLVGGWVLWFFRDPERTPPEGAHRLVSPADGLVTQVDEVDEPVYVKGPAKRVSIFMNIFSVHVNRAPLAGTVRHAEHHAGEFVNAMREDSSHINEHFDLGVETAAGRMLVRQVAGLVARRIVCATSVGATLERGERFGMIKFGSRVEVFLPVDNGFSPSVKVGDTVLAGASVLGEVSE